MLRTAAANMAPDVDFNWIRIGRCAVKFGRPLGRAPVTRMDLCSHALCIRGRRARGLASPDPESHRDIR
jgi:hypothetical protein